MVKNAIHLKHEMGVCVWNKCHLFERGKWLTESRCSWASARWASRASSCPILWGSRFREMAGNCLCFRSDFARARLFSRVLVISIDLCWRDTKVVAIIAAYSRNSLETCWMTKFVRRCSAIAAVAVADRHRLVRGSPSDLRCETSMSTVANSQDSAEEEIRKSADEPIASCPSQCRLDCTISWCMGGRERDSQEKSKIGQEVCFEGNVLFDVRIFFFNPLLLLLFKALFFLKEFIFEFHNDPHTQNNTVQDGRTEAGRQAQQLNLQQLTGNLQSFFCSFSSISSIWLIDLSSYCFC